MPVHQDESKKSDCERAFEAYFGAKMERGHIMAVLIKQHLAVKELANRRWKNPLKQPLIQIVDPLRKAAAEYQEALHKEIEIALKTGDGSFFKQFAEAIEILNQKDNSLRLELLVRKPMLVAKPKTVREIKELLIKSGMMGEQYSEAVLSRLCKELEIPVPKGRVGRPKKSSNIQKSIRTK